MNPSKFFQCLGDDTRLTLLLLLDHAGELCVCDLVSALNRDQPTISRHLAALRQRGIVIDQRRGKWVFYRLHPELANWARKVIHSTALNNASYYQAALSCITDTQNDCKL
jgi:ArsR family transcriptional regulator